MATKAVTPKLGAKSFSCPHCGAIAHQSWYMVYLDIYEKDAGPWMPSQETLAKLQQDETLESETKKKWAAAFKKQMTRALFVETHKQSHYSNFELINAYVSRCFSCNAFAVWIADQLMYPVRKYDVKPNADMPDDIKGDFIEASSILEISPRGAAALLRLCIQKLMVHLGEKGKNIDTDIGNLVKRGLDAKIQKALDIVRVIGNNAVHPGQIELTDDKATAERLFSLVNLIVESTITVPKHLKDMYDALPQGALDAIEKRDKPKP